MPLIALEETVHVQVAPYNKKSYTIDFEFTFHCAAEIPFKILEYRYAGFCWRVTEAWHQGNSKVLTSTGLDRTKADGSRADWFIIQSNINDKKAGAMMMSHADNHKHPQPLRIWPPQKNERTQIMAMFAPTKYSNWLLKPSTHYTLKYRMFVFDGKMSYKKANRLYSQYSGSK